MDVGGGGTEGSLNRPSGAGMKPAEGPEDKNGVEAKGGTGGVGRKEGGSDPTMELAPVDENGATVCEG